MTDAQAAAVAPTSGSTVVTVGIGFFVNGTKVTGTFPAVPVTISCASIAAGSTVYFVNGSSLQAISGASVASGSVTFNVTSDPTVQVVSASSSVPGASNVITGKPFLLEGILAIGLVASGSLMLRRLRHRRRFN
jgi:hypothetical protein